MTLAAGLSGVLKIGGNMSTFYEVNVDGESKFYLSYRQAVWTAISAAPFANVVRLDRIETPRINKDLVLTVLNRQDCVEERETMVLIEYGEFSKSIAAPGSHTANL